MKNLMNATLAALAILALPVLSFAEGKSIYGGDNRLNYYEAAATMQTMANSVVSLWRSYKLTDSGSNYTLTTRTLREAKGLCPGEKFENEKVGAFCSGSLVGEDLIMTAGHCITDQAACDGTRFVFGFKVDAAGGTGPGTVAKSEVYSCKSIVTRYLSGEDGTSPQLGADYALVKLDRKVTGHTPLKINRSGSISVGTKLFVIGHPSGLPVKVAAESKVRSASQTGYFVADLDTFGGNSGSAVFNLRTKKIEGILVRGDEDYIPTPAGCNTVAVFDQAGGRGEDVTKISALSAHIPRLPGEKNEDLELFAPRPYVAPADNPRVAPPVIPVNPF